MGSLFLTVRQAFSSSTPAEDNKWNHMTSRDRVRFYINNTATYKNTYRKTNVGDCTEYSPCFAHPTRWPWSGSLNPSMSLSSSLYMFLKLAVKGTSVDTATDEIDQINYQPKAHQLSQSYIQVSAVHLTKLGLIKIDLPPSPTSGFFFPCTGGT